MQPIAGNRHAVCTTHARETLTFNYERALFDTVSGPVADPRVTHQVTLDTDGYGNPFAHSGNRLPSPTP